MTAALDETFVKLPHTLLSRALSLGLSGCEWDVILLLVRFSYGFQKDDCSASLTRLAKKCTHSRRQIGRALQRLCRLGLIELWQEPTYRKAGQYVILDQCSMDATVAQTPHSKDIETEDSGIDSDTSATPSGIDATQSGTSATESGIDATLGYPQIPADKADNARKKQPKETLLKKSFKEKGYIDTSVAFSNPTSTLIKDSSLRSVLSGDSVPLPDGTPLKETDRAKTVLYTGEDGMLHQCEIQPEQKPPASQKPKPDPKPIVQHFEDELGIQANATQEELDEIQNAMSGCNTALFQSAFFKFISAIKAEGVTDLWRKQGRVVSIARASANKAKQNGDYNYGVSR
jgi:hypothetical protein